MRIVAALGLALGSCTFVPALASPAGAIPPVTSAPATATATATAATAATQSQTFTGSGFAIGHLYPGSANPEQYGGFYSSSGQLGVGKIRYDHSRGTRHLARFTRLSDGMTLSG